MKTVFTDVRDIAHIWAHQTQEEAKNPSRNFFFTGKTIYSYGNHFPIAKYIDSETLLITYRGYSNTTSKHISVVRSAIPYGRKVIYCYCPNNSHEDNLKKYASQIEEELKGITNARKPEKYINAASRYVSYAESYIGFFNLKTPEILQRLFDLTNKDEYVKYILDKKSIIEKEEKKKRNVLLRKFKDDVLKWRSFETNKLYGRHTERDFLRVDFNKMIVQTSQGIDIPIDVALRFNKSIENCLTNGVCDNLKILSYDVKEVTKDYIIIGCHKIDHKERIELIKQLNN
jgi:hypothetical protein